jgi:hypothetical protein
MVSTISFSVIPVAMFIAGFGFGPAARLCALRSRFEPARDVAGQPIAAHSPPIRVHFFRY